jgi:hypothetical protein
MHSAEGPFGPRCARASNYALKRTCAEEVSDAINRCGRAGRLA